MAKIIVERRTDDWIAFIGDKTKWEAGKTSAEAIGKLVFYRSKEFNIEIEIK